MVKIKVYLNSPSPFSITFKDVNKFDIQNLVTGNLLSQVNANQLTDQLAKNILGKGEHLKIRARLDALRNNTFTGGDDVDGRRGGSGSYRHNFQKKKSQKQQSSRITSITTNCLNNKFEASNSTSTFNIKMINKAKK